MFKITIIALGNKMPDWVHQGCQEYSKRLQNGIAFQLVEIPLLARSKNSDLGRIMEKEAALIKQAIPNQAKIIALDVEGKTFDSEGLAAKISQLQQVTSHICLLIGGPEGLSDEILGLCDEKWSLSKLTLPHPLVRIVLFETLYRAWTIITNHPYHKA